MPAERVCMRSVREILRLKFHGQRPDPRDRPAGGHGALDGACGAA